MPHFMPHSLIRSTEPTTQARDAAPSFAPHPWVKGGHAQTIGGWLLGGGRLGLEVETLSIDLGDGDHLCVLESIPRGWRVGEPAAVLIHGLAGSAGAPYLIRFANRLHAMGVRVVRMNLRGAGEGFGLARRIYHAGRSADVRTVVDWLADRARGSPIAVAGFSLGASLALKLAAEAAERPAAGLDCILAANPPIDLLACARRMQEPENFVYDRNFVRWLRGEVVKLHRRFPDLGAVDLQGVRSVYTFDDLYTAPRNGFASADDYYQRSSAGPLAPRIALAGLVVHAADDPFIPVEAFRSVAFPANVDFELCAHGGHLGYISRTPWRGDRRWLEARLADWLCRRWGLGG
ncbi:YheT family hydrolase [Paludisphaera borealis]|nr:alpha/beta fold hydrolase [Paludisphaera borealis]